MATREFSIYGHLKMPDAGVTPDLIANQISLTNPAIGNVPCFVMNGASDEGIYGNFGVPAGTVNSQVIVIHGILDGAPGAAETLGFGIQGSPLADNEASDAAFGTADVVTATIGSSGSGHSDEDEYRETISLSNFALTAQDNAYFYFFIDASGTTYGGNFLLTDLRFQYDDGS